MAERSHDEWPELARKLDSEHTAGSWKRSFTIKMPDFMYERIEELRRLMGARSTAKAVVFGLPWLKLTIDIVNHGYDVVLKSPSGEEIRLTNNEVREKLNMPLSGKIQNGDQ